MRTLRDIERDIEQHQQCRRNLLRQLARLEDKLLTLEDERRAAAEESIKKVEETK
jgi:hypothetical protein